MDFDVDVFKNVDKLYTKKAQDIVGQFCGVVVYNGGGVHNAWRKEALEGRHFCDFLQICDKKYFVKYPTLNTIKNINKTFNELFISFLAGKLGLPCIDSKVFIDNELGSVGVISSHIGRHFLVSDLCVSLCMHHAKSVPEIVAEITENLEHRYVCEGKFVVDQDNLKHSLMMLSCFDFLISQDDRHCGNMAVSITPKGDASIITCAPIFDNDDAFCQVNPYYPTYQLVPTEGRYGDSQRELMNTDEKFNKFYNAYQDLVGGDNFNKTLAEFESIYGFGKICELADKSEEYSKIIKDVKTSIQGKIEYVDRYQNARQ